MTSEFTMNLSLRSHSPSIVLPFFAIGLLPVIAVLFPRALSFAPAVVGLLSLVAGYFFLKLKPVCPNRLVVILLSVFGLCTLSLIWTITPEETLDRIVKLLPIFLGGCFFVMLCLTVNKTDMDRYFVFLPLGLAIGALLTTIEIFFDAPVYRLIREIDPDDEVSTAVFNRGAVSLILCSVPVLAAMAVMKQINGIWILFLCLLPMLFSVQSQSSQLAIVVAGITFFLFPYNRPKVWYVLAALMAIVILLSPFLSIVLFDYLAKSLNEMWFFGKGYGYAGARLEIWDYVSRYVLQQRPLYGFGLEASRVITDFDSKQIFQEGTSILHPHNFAIQLWLEFGVIGALAGSCFCVYVFLFILKRFPIQEKKIALSTYLACLSIASMTYGLWQSWWVGLAFMVTGFCILSMRLLENSQEIKEG